MDRSEPTQKMLHEAVKKAVELKLIPKAGFEDQIVESWKKIEAVLRAALAVQD